MLSKSGSRQMQVYSYQITIFESAAEKYRGIKTDLIGEYERNLSNTVEAIKSQLIRQFKNSYNHAAYAIESSQNLPLQETLLPVAKRSLVRYIANGAVA